MAIKPRALIDVDGVLRDFVGSLKQIYLQQYPDHVIREPITSRALEDFFPIGNAIYQFMDEHYATEILRDAPAYPGAIEALQKWDEKFEIVIATAQPPEGRAPTLEWLGKHGVPAKEVHMIYDKYQLMGAALLDDFSHNLQAFHDTGRMAVCLAQPWNSDWAGVRVDTVDEFFRHVEAMLKIENDEIEGGPLIA